MSCRYTYKGKTYEVSEFDDLLRAMAPAEAAAFMLGVEAVPSAPFVQKTDAWVALALKRVIKMAADEGYDRVAFINGEQSAERYDLSKQVESIDAKRFQDGTYHIDVGTKDGRDFNRHGLTAGELEDHVGKEMAQKIVDATKNTGKRVRFSGLDLKVGGEGMRAFYDQIVPATLKDVLRKVGGGQLVPVAFDKGNQSGWYERSPSGANLGFTQDAATAQRWRAAGLNVVSESMSQPGFDITPAMREKAADGLPMFSRRQTETPEFRNWFGDSKVVDENGQPLVVYHGTHSQGIDVFEPGRVGAMYFTPDIDYAKRYGDVVMPVFLKVRKLADLTDSNSDAYRLAVKTFDESGGWAASEDAWDSMREDGRTNPMFDPALDMTWEIFDLPEAGVDAALLSAGYDGVKLQERPGIDSYAVFEPTQIKSAIGNNGNFDPNDPRIAYSRRPSGLPGESRFMRMRRLLQDQFIQVKVIQDTLTKRGGTVGEAQDVYRAEERMHGRVTALLQDFARNQIEPFVKKVVDYGLTLDEVSLYAYAMHAKERNAYIKSINPKIGDAGSGMSDTEADNIIQLAQLSGDQAKFDDLHQMLMGITDTTRHVLLQEGLITRQEFDGWTNLYQNYVPLRGFEGVDPEGNPMPRNARGFSMTGKESIKALGRKSKAGQILENIIRDYERAVARSEKNAVAKTFLDLALSNPDPDLWEVHPVKYNRTFNKASGMVLMRKADDTGPDTFAVKVAGQQVRIKVKDELLLRALKLAGKEETSQLERLLASTLGAYTDLMRNTLTRYNPIFGAINAVRDLQMGAVSSLDELGSEGAKLYAKYYGPALAASWRSERGAAANKTMDRWMTEMRFAGGSTGGYHTRDLNEITGSMKTMLLQHGASPTTKMEAIRGSLAYRQAAAAMKWLEIIGATSEDAARLAAYRAAREMGRTPAQAASIAKNLTTNFNRKGEWGQTLNSLYLFFNAAVQGSVRVIQALGSRRVQYLMAGLTAASMAIALANAAAGDDDDGEAYWDKIPDFEKERNLIFMLPPGVDMEGSTKIGKHGRYIKIPMPYGLNVFPVLGMQLADLTRNMRDGARGVGPAKAAVNMVSAVLGSVNPFGGSFDPSSAVQWGLAAAPSAADLAIQLMAGVNAFGRPVGPEKSPFDDKPDSETFSARQAGGAAQRTAQWLNSVSGGNAGRSGYLDFQPGTLENVVRNTTGGLGVFLADTMVNLPTKFVAAPESMTFRDVPLWRNFYGQVDAMTDQSLFYERRAEVMRELDAAKREMKLGVSVDYSPESQAMQALGAAAESYTKWMTQLRRQEIEIAADPNMTRGEKLIARRELDKARGQIAEGFNTAYIDSMRALKSKPETRAQPATN